MPSVNEITYEMKITLLHSSHDLSQSFIYPLWPNLLHIPHTAVTIKWTQELQ